MTTIQFTEAEVQEIKMTEKKLGEHTRTHEEIIGMIGDDLEELHFLRGEIRALTQRVVNAETDLAMYKFSHYGSEGKMFFVKLSS